MLSGWLKEQGGRPDDHVFPSSNGGRLSADALQSLVSRHVTTAKLKCPSLVPKNVTPHTLRHAAAMDLLHNGVELGVIALWLGHESTETTQVYLHADMQLKEQALAHATSSGLKPDRFQAPDSLLDFLEKL
jgi:integrase/recombinase XerD